MNNPIELESENLLYIRKRTFFRRWFTWFIGLSWILGGFFIIIYLKTIQEKLQADILETTILLSNIRKDHEVLRKFVDSSLKTTGDEIEHFSNKLVDVEVGANELVSTVRVDVEAMSVKLRTMQDDFGALEEDRKKTIGLLLKTLDSISLKLEAFEEEFTNSIKNIEGLADNLRSTTSDILSSNNEELNELLNRGINLMRVDEKNYQAAYNMFESALGLAKTDQQRIRVLTEMAISQISSQKFLDAIRLLKEAYKLDNTDGFIDFLLGESYFLYGKQSGNPLRYNEAIRHFNRAIRNNYKIPSLYYKLGEIYSSELNKNLAAVGVYSEAIELYPKNLELILKRAESNYKINRLRMSMTDLSVLLEQNYKPEISCYLVADITLILRELEGYDINESLAYYEKSLKALEDIKNNDEASMILTNRILSRLSLIRYIKKEYDESIMSTDLIDLNLNSSSIAWLSMALSYRVKSDKVSFNQAFSTWLELRNSDDEEFIKRVLGDSFTELDYN